MQWHDGSIAEAVAKAKKNNKLFLVYVEGTDDMSKTMATTFDDPSISKKLSCENVVALKLIANSVPYMQFCQIYPVLVIPSSFFIAGSGAPIEIITGSLLPEEFSSKLDKVFEMYEKTLSTKTLDAPSTSAQKDDISAASSSGADVDISQPSTSQATASDSSSLEEKVERAKALIEAQRQNKAVEEQEKEKNEELTRRNMGKAMQQAQVSRKENELKEWARNHAKEKEEERLAREKVKAMIAQDRAEQAIKYQRVKDAEEAERRKLQQQREEEERIMREAAMNSNDARLQFRLPDGSHSNHTFSADDTFEVARSYVRETVRPPFSNFTLCTTFPRRHFTETDYTETLRELQLAPSAVLLILPAQAVTSVKNSSNFISSIFWILLSPITSIWSYIGSFFGSNSNSPTVSPPRPNQNTPNTQPTANEEPKTQSDNRQAGVRRRESPFAKREGNIFRINNQSDDDENNTWNGNSTQQM